jgi:hypothetical protein
VGRQVRQRQDDGLPPEFTKKVAPSRSRRDERVGPLGAYGGLEVVGVDEGVGAGGTHGSERPNH